MASIIKRVLYFAMLAVLGTAGWMYGWVCSYEEVEIPPAIPTCKIDENLWFHDGEAGCLPKDDAYGNPGDPNPGLPILNSI